MKQPILFLLLISSFIHNLLYAQSSAAYLVDSLNEKAFIEKRVNKAAALSMLVTAESLAVQHHYQRGLSVAYLYEGGVFQQSGYTKKALALYYQSLGVSRAAGDTFDVARANQQIAGILNEDGKADAAEQLLLQSLRAYQWLKKSKEVVNVSNSLGLVYLGRKKFADAAVYFDSALHASVQLDYSYGMRKALYNQGLLNAASNAPEKARACFEQSRAMSMAAKDAYGIASCEIQLAGIAATEGNRSSWLSVATHAFETAGSIGALQLQHDAVAQLIKAYNESGDKEPLIRWQQQMIDVQQKLHDTDRASSAEFIDIFKSQEFKNQAAMKQVADAEHVSHNQRLLLLMVGVLLLLLLLTGIPIYLNYKKARMFSQELEQKNNIIEKNATSLDLLNKAISRQNQRLEEENKMKDKLLSIISHDLRHPLVNTKSILDLINLKLVSPDETSELLEQLENQYIHSLTLLDNLLFWIRAQMKGVKIGRTRVNMHLLINSLIAEQRVLQQQKKIQVHNQVSDQLEWLAEKEMLKIIFRNLLSNALKFTPVDGQVFFSSSLEGEEARITVRDTGVGISKEVLDKINNSQYFSSKGTSNEKGSGFGLVLVRELLSRHEATLHIESQPGEGSSFTVKFRYAETDKA